MLAVTGETAIVEGDAGSGMLLIADHASNHVPPDIDLGIPAFLLDEHIAVDIGIDRLARTLCSRLGCPAVIAGVSRLVVDLNREPDEPNLIPVSSDGHAVPGNAGLSAEERAARIERFWRPYHQAVERMIDARRPAMLISLHSFTPQLASQPEQTRPWEIGILYNRDERAARIALPLLAAQGVVAGDNQPYSGRTLNATMNRHAESRALPYLGLEVRQDLIMDDEGIERWSGQLAPVILATRQALGRERQ